MKRKAPLMREEIVDYPASVGGASGEIAKLPSAPSLFFYTTNSEREKGGVEKGKGDRRYLCEL